MQETALLKLLEKNARMELCDLAAALNESEDNVQTAMQQLTQDQIILGHHTLINWDKTNTDRVMALIEVSVMPEREYGYDRIAKQIYRYPEVDTMYLMSGKSEFIVIIYGKTMQEIAQFVGSKLACIDKVTGTCTLFVLKKYKGEGIVFEMEEEANERLLVTP
ncbi:MAG: Lrp/AsnC family transcriptional regulator [Erysipelotrichaceae bacterium]|nr:Lrp/AsnC family transcriptional regulator [Erysipelotrichaceae bacterium]MCI9311963.1 Lrp/AsnC family transcriptional regulator [Erysipelotrichaceae bacterium]